MVEYALIAALVSVATITILTLLHDSIILVFIQVWNDIPRYLR
jgi:Flp pilus assembly pilin Flp